MMFQAAPHHQQQQQQLRGTTHLSKERQAAGQLDTAPMSLPADQWSPSTGTKAMHLEPAGSQAWTLPVTLRQEPAPCLDSALDEPLYSPFLHAMGAIGRPSMLSTATAAADTLSGSFKSSSSFTGSTTPASAALVAFNSCSAAAQHAGPSTASSNGSSSRRSFDVPFGSPAGTAAGSTAKRVSWLDPSHSDASTGLSKGSPTPGFSTVSAGVLRAEGMPSAHGSPAHSSSIWSNDGLLSVNNVPASSAGDLRDQGSRLSCAGGVPAALLLGATTQEALPLEEACTPLQVDCISSLLGSLGASLFSDTLPATPPSRTAAAAAAAAVSAAAAEAVSAKQAPVLPDLVEEWEGRRSSSQSDTAAEAAAAAAIAVSSARSSFSSRAGSVFDGADGPAFSMGAGSSSQAVPYPHPPAHAFSTPEPARYPSPALQQGFPAAAHNGSAGHTRLQHASSIGGAAPAGAGSFAPALLSPAFSSTPGQLISSLSMPLSMAHGMPSSGPLAPAVYGSPAAAAAAAYAAVMQAQAYQQSTIAAAAATAAAAGAPAGVYQAWALAYLGAAGAGSGPTSFHHDPTQALLCNPLASWASQPGSCFPLGAPEAGQWRQPAVLQPSNSFGREQQQQQQQHSGRFLAGRSRFGAATNSKADPKSMCGVDPRLCVGSPADVKAEVCRRNPGLAELLRLPPRSVKLSNVAVRPDTCPAELLASKRPDGPIVPEELTIESGLLRHCFGLPSSIGPDLVRAARQSVTRGDATPGSGLEPFFWVLQAKLNWLLKRPVFFKGQLLRGEIHGITDHQRAASFAQVTEQRSKLGELLLVLYSMLQAADCQQQA